MKKLLLTLIFIIIVIIIFQKLIGFYSSNKSIISQINNQSTTTQEMVSTAPEKPKLGIRYRMIDAEIADQNGLIEGAYISQVTDGSPADVAGVQDEDIIIKVNGIKIGSGDQQFLNKLISKINLGEKISLEIWRNNEIKTITITL